MNFAATTPLSRLSFLSVVAVLSLLSPVHAQQPTLTNSPNQIQPIDPNAPNNLRPIGQNDGILSMEGGRRIMKEAEAAANAQNYTLAAKKYQDARTIFNQLSNYYQDLNSSFSGINNRVADSHRKNALETAQMRDQATYQLAFVHRSQNQPDLAVPLLIQIIKSQNPTRDLGKQAYQQLVEIGFVNASNNSASNNSNQIQPINLNNSNNPASTTQTTGILNMDGGRRLMKEAEAAVNSQNYTLAAKKYQDARMIFNQLSNFYQDLNSSFSGIDSKVADLQRKNALDTAQMRDEATYKLALVHRAQNQADLAVPLLLQVVKSQNPTRELGKKSYQQLVELGFVGASSTSSSQK